MLAATRPAHPRSRRPLSETLALLLAVAAAAVAVGVPAAGAALVPVEWVQGASFACTHAPVDWVVPAGVSSVDVVATGAAGMDNASHNGGLGARVTGTIAVAAGETLHLRVGCWDGYNGGGETGALDGAGNGGGATDVRQGGDGLANRIVTAGGGGGGGDGGLGGTASGPTGGNGAGGLNDGLGATPTAGGYRGGSYGQGGNGEPMVGGGAGGGGVYGGGGSGSYAFCELCQEPTLTPGGGGGAGSSAGPVGATIAAAPGPGNGSLSLAWVVTEPVTIATTTTLTDTPEPTALGEQYTVTAAVTSASGPVTVGSVSFTSSLFASTITVPVTSAGTATLWVTLGDVGTSTWHAVYNPGDGYLTSEADATHSVGDSTGPDVSTAFPATPASGWFAAPVVGSVSASDADAIASLDCSGASLSDPSGIGGSSATGTLTVSAEGESTVSCAATDPSGNSTSSIPHVLKVDTIAPTLAWSGGPASGATYTFGAVPEEPTCGAIDGGSGSAGCVVAGYSSAVGTHVLTASATDIAGHTTVETRTYVVSAWRLTGFYSPVDMGGVVNTVKGGSTVPLKFEVFAGAVEQTSAAAVQSLRAINVSCAAGLSQDEIEVTSAGGTALRYDTTEGLFIYNWKTPKTAGACLDVIVQTLDGSTIPARFRLR